MTVTKQQQLEFAAKHIEKWKSGYDFAVIEKMNDGQLCVRWPSICSEGVSKKEWQQEREKMQKQDGSWHERGELPPVGCECEIMHRLWIKPKEVKIAAITKEYVIVVDGQCEQHYYLRDITFRPLRTERENAIDELNALVGDIEKYPTWRDAIAGIIDAGYRKVKP